MRRGLALAIVLALSTAACGGGPQTRQLLDVPAKGGAFRIAAQGDVDSLDPARGNNSFSRMLFRVLTRNLVHYPALPGSEGNALVGDIATDTGQVTGGGTTYTFNIRPGVKYQPEVAGGREVQSKDFKYAIERAFYPSVASPFARAYFSDLFVGDEAFLAAPGPATHIGGIDVTDPRRIVFNLKRPTGDFRYRLALPLASPVPEEYARTFDLTPRSAYAANLAATGPYQIQRQGGTVTGYEPGDRIVLSRNTSWDAASDPIRKAYPDRIEVAQRFDQADTATEAILAGQFDYNGDFSIPPDRVDQIVDDRSLKDRLFTNPGTCMRYVALNTTIAPLDNVKVRQAIAYALDRESMRARRGGPRAGHIAGHVLTPGQDGFSEAGGLTYNPYPSDRNQGNLTKAQEVLKEAGFITGTVVDDRGRKPRILMVSDLTGTQPLIADIVQKALESLGFEVTREAYKTNEMVRDFLSVPDQDVAVAPNVGSCWDYPDGGALISRLFDGRRITQTGNTNYSLINDQALNTAIDQASLAGAETRADAWAEVDKSVMDLVPVIPWLWDTTTSLISSRVVNYQYSVFSSSVDLAVVAVKAAPAP